MTAGTAQLTQAEAKIAELRASAESDFLLDILNRRGFARELTRAVAFIARYSATGALIVLDVDRLKPINDAFGHGRECVRSGGCSGDVRIRVMGVGGDELCVAVECQEVEGKGGFEAAIDQLTFVFRDITCRLAPLQASHCWVPMSMAKPRWFRPTGRCTCARPRDARKCS